MRNVILIMSFILFSLIGHSQATAVADFRIANATTAFGKNLPVGTKVYDINTGDYFVANTGVTSASTLTTASASFDQINAGGSPTTLSAGTVTATTYGITSDGSADDIVLPEATTTTAGLLGADKWDEIVANTAKVSNVTTNLSLGTATSTTVDVNSSDGTNATLVAATGTDAGLLTAADKTKLDGIDTGAEVNLTILTEDFEEDDGTATAHTLSQTAVTAQSARVSLNGAVLKPGDYTFTTTTITIGVPVAQYDQVVITYSY